MSYRGRSFHASMVGSILTFLGVIALLAYTVFIVVQITGDNKHFNLDVSAKRLESLVMRRNG